MLDAWLILPISFIIATIASSSGIGGAVFFSPLFLVVYNLPVELAFALSLFIEIFGFGSGLIAYLREKLIDFRLAGSLLFYVLPGIIIGIYSFEYFPEETMKTAFEIFLLLIGLLLIVDLKRHRISKKECRLRCIKWKKGRICYDLPKERFGINGIVAVGGVLVGMFSSGIGEINEYIFLKKLKMHAALAAGTSLFVVAISAIVGSTFKITLLLNRPELIYEAIPLAMFAIPGVILGGQMGARISERVAKPAVMRKLIGGLVVFIAILMLLFNVA